MIHKGKSELICDFAETYHIYELRSLPARLVATLAVGLRDNSRIKMKITGTDIPVDTLLLSMIYDSLNILVWRFASKKGTNKPESVAQKLLEKEKEDKTVKQAEVFNSPEEYEAERARLLAKIKQKGSGI